MYSLLTKDLHKHEPISRPIEVSYGHILKPVQQVGLAELECAKERNDVPAIERNLNCLLPLLEKLGW